MNIQKIARTFSLCFLLLSAPAFAVTDDDLNLIEAAGRGDLVIFEMMLGMGANPDAANYGGNSAILQAAYHERRDMVRRLIDFKVDVNRKGRLGYTPLGIAASHADDKIVDMLIAAGANLNVRDDAGGTPLLNAIRYGRDRNVHSLLAAGADADMAGSGGEVPLMQAAELGRLDYVDLLLSKGAHVWNAPDALYYAIYEGHDEVARRLIKAGSNLHNLVNGYSPLHWARVLDRQEIAQLLVKAGAVE